MKQKITTAIISVITIVGIIPTPTFAAKKLQDSTGFADKVAGKAGLFDRSITGTVASAITGALSLIAIFFFILMVYGGYLWMTARGNDEQVTKAQDLIKDAIIGMIIVIMAYGMTLVVGRMVG